MDRSAQSGAEVEAPVAVIHLVGRVTDSVFSFLGPATATLARQGSRQTVVLIDDPLHRHILPKFHESVRLVLTTAKGSASDQMRALLDAYCDAANGSQPAIAHLHGLVCSLLGVYAARWRGVSLPTFFSPHGSKLLGPLRGLGSVFVWIMGPLSSALGQRALVNSNADATSLSRMTKLAVPVIESPVADSFFAEDAAPNAQPRIVSAGRAPNPVGAAQFAQCAVVLRDQLPGLEFIWMGAADAESVARLTAAGIELQDLSDDTDRAARLAQSWIYVAPGGGLGFPVFLTEAMALGIPCIAWDTPYHRDIIDDGVSGFLCKDMYGVLARADELLESSALRSRIGQSARANARSRFDGGRFRDSLLGFYEAPSRATARLYRPSGGFDGDQLSGSFGTARSRRRARLMADFASRAVRTTLAKIALPIVGIAAIARPDSGKSTRRDDRRLNLTALSRENAASMAAQPAGIQIPDVEHLLAMQEAGDLSLAIVWSDHQAVGTATVEWLGARDTKVRDLFVNCPEIHSVSVHQSKRSIGVGSLLVGTCEGWARERGHRFVGATVSADNGQAYSLFLRLGYVEPQAMQGTAQTERIARPRERFMIKAIQ